MRLSINGLLYIFDKMNSEINHFLYKAKKFNLTVKFGVYTYKLSTMIRVYLTVGIAIFILGISIQEIKTDETDRNIPDQCRNLFIDDWGGSSYYECLEKCKLSFCIQIFKTYLILSKIQIFIN